MWGSIRMLARFYESSTGLDRNETLKLEGRLKTTVDSRLAYLSGKNLIKMVKKEQYHDRAKYKQTVMGRTITKGLCSNRCVDCLLYTSPSPRDRG